MIFWACLIFFAIVVVMIIAGIGIFSLLWPLFTFVIKMIEIAVLIVFVAIPIIMIILMIFKVIKRIITSFKERSI